MVIAYQWLGLLVINRQPLAHGTFSIVFALLQRFTGDVVHTLSLWRVVDHVIYTARSGVYPATGDALDQLFVFNLNLHHSIDRNAGLIHGLGLGNGPRKPVEQEAVGTVIGLNAFFHQIDDDVIRDQGTRIHHRFHPVSQLAARANSRPQHVPSGDLRDA